MSKVGKKSSDPGGKPCTQRTKVENLTGETEARHVRPKETRRKGARGKCWGVKLSLVGDGERAEERERRKGVLKGWA